MNCKPTTCDGSCIASAVDGQRSSHSVRPSVQQLASQIRQTVANSVRFICMWRHWMPDIGDGSSNSSRSSSSRSSSMPRQVCFHPTVVALSSQSTPYEAAAIRTCVNCWLQASSAVAASASAAAVSVAVAFRSLFSISAAIGAAVRKDKTSAHQFLDSFVVSNFRYAGRDVSLSDGPV